MDKQTILVHGVLTFSESISLTLELDKKITTMFTTTSLNQEFYFTIRVKAMQHIFKWCVL